MFEIGGKLSTAEVRLIYALAMRSTTFKLFIHTFELILETWPCSDMSMESIMNIPERHRLALSPPLLIGTQNSFVSIGPERLRFLASCHP